MDQMLFSNTLHIAGDQRLGDRAGQEDSFEVIRLGEGGGGVSSVLILVADGMGGHVGGAVASRLVIDAFATSYISASAQRGVPERLEASLHAANDSLRSETVEKPELSGMGTTLIACVVSERELYWLSVGDSPLWLLRDGALRRLNADHSMKPVLSGLVEKGKISLEQSLLDPRRNALQSAVIGRDIAMIDVLTQPFRLQQGDILLASTDGMETLDQQEIETALSKKHDVEARLSNLLDAVIVRDLPGQDNATGVLLEVHSDASGERPATSASSLARKTDALKHFPAGRQELSGRLIFAVLASVFVLFGIASAAFFARDNATDNKTDETLSVTDGGEPVQTEGTAEGGFSTEAGARTIDEGGE